MDWCLFEKQKNTMARARLEDRKKRNVLQTNARCQGAFLNNIKTNNRPTNLIYVCINKTLILGIQNDDYNYYIIY